MEICLETANLRANSETVGSKRLNAELEGLKGSL